MLTAERPESPEAEQAVLGAVILNAAYAAKVRLEWFNDPQRLAAAKIFKAMAEDGEPIDPATLAPKFAAAKVPHSLFVDFVDACYSVHHFDAWAKQLSADAQKRAVLMLCEDYHDRAATGTLNINDLVESVSEISMPPDVSKKDDISGDMAELLDEWERASRGEKPPGVETGFEGIDRALGRLQPGSMNIVAARPSEGKTSLGLNIALRVAQTGLPVAIFSMEMPRKQLVHRLWCNLADVNSQAIALGQLTDVDFVRVAGAQDTMKTLPLVIRDEPVTVGSLRMQVSDLVRFRKVGLVVIDYLGLIQASDKYRSRYESITAISNSLKGMALQTGIPFVVLAQLNRDSDKGNREPRLSDLRDSGSIEQDADSVMLMHEDEKGFRIIVGKNRHGRSGDIIWMNFYKGSSRMECINNEPSYG